MSVEVLGDAEEVLHQRRVLEVVRRGAEVVGRLDRPRRAEVPGQVALRGGDVRPLVGEGRRAADLVQVLERGPEADRSGGTEEQQVPWCSGEISNVLRERR